MKAWPVLLLSTTLATFADASEYTTPSSMDTVIATWPAPQLSPAQDGFSSKPVPPDDADAVIARVNDYLAQAAKPGQSRLYSLAHAALAPLIERQSESPNIWLAWAQVRQHQHDFNEALLALDKVVQRQPENTNAHLLRARIHLVNNDVAAARSACLRLIGNADLLTVSGCVLEVAGLSGELSSSYQQLSSMVKNQGLPADERGPWLTQILADMAHRLDDPAAAAQWLSEQPLELASVNYLAQWADVQLELSQQEKVLKQLGPIVENAADTDDALLLRLALAEKATAGERWQNQARLRMNLREQRADTQHASELARFFLDLASNPQKALHWAEINWQNAREHSDKKLLERARADVRQLEHGEGQ